MPQAHARAFHVAVPRRTLLYACFVLSGAAGLALQIVWSKYLSLILGNAIHGVATVVAAFLGGLGLGAWIGGRLAARTREPLLAYARIELVVGILGIVSPLAFLAARPLFTELYGAFGGPTTTFVVIRFFALFGALLIPTVAMGATLPLVSSDLVRRGSAFGSEVGRLYALNTAGAVAGVVAAGFILVPTLGLWKTALLAGILDIAVGAAVTLLRPAPPPPAEAERLETSGAPGGARPRSAFASLVVPLFAVSGFTAILYEIAWTRILSVPLGGMVYALSAILGLYLLGIALGSAAASRLLRANAPPAFLFGVLQVALAAAVAGGAHLFGWIHVLQASVIDKAMRDAWSMGGPFTFFAGGAGISALVVLAPALILGALFPTAAAVYQAGRREAGASVGGIYAANTVGSIAGSLLTGFVLIPAIGALGAILLGAALNLGIGILALLLGEGPRQRRLVLAVSALAFGIVFVAFALPERNVAHMNIGLTRLLRSYWLGGEEGTRKLIAEADAAGTAEHAEQIVFAREGRLANVAVVEIPHQKRVVLLINGKPDAMIGESGDMRQQVLLGQLPMLVAPRAEDVCIVGYGSGVSTHAVLTHPVKTALTVELEEAVIEAAHFFAAGAFDPLSDPRHTLLVEDAGTFIRSTGRTFDVIINEPTNPWIAGVGDLFTREFYEEAAGKIRPGGILCQWMQFYETSRATFHTVLRTLVRRFPRGQLFYCWPTRDMILLASADGEVLLDIDRMQAAFQRREVAEDLRRIGVDSVTDILRFYRGSLETAAALAGDGPINTDDNGWLEHRAPLDLVTPQHLGEPVPWSDQVADDLARSLRPGPERVAPVLAAALQRALEVAGHTSRSDPALARSNIAAARGFARAL